MTKQEFQRQAFLSALAGNPIPLSAHDMGNAKQAKIESHIHTMLHIAAAATQIAEKRLMLEDLK